MINKDRWSQLSLQEKADLFKLYIDNGITNIKDIRNHYNSFGDGGEINDNENTKGYTTTNNEELQDVETFNSNWYKYRDSQLASVVKSYPSPHHVTRGLNFWQTSFPMFVDDTKLASGARNYMEERLKHLKEFTLEEAVKDKQARQVLVDDYYKYFPSERKENEVEIGPPKSPDNYSLIRLQELIHKGGYSRPAHIAIYSNGYENTSTKIHERAHAAIPKSVISYHPILNPIKNVFLQKDVKVNNYYDDIGEIYSRLMQMRFENKIDPSHKYTLEEVKAMRDNSNFKDFNIFNRYTDDSILMLLNDVAQNTTDSNKLDYINPANIAAFGGKLNKFSTGGSTEPLYYDNTPIEPAVVKAFKSNEAYNRYYGDNFGKQVAKQRDNVAKKIVSGLEFTPILGDSIDISNVVASINKGEYSKAAALAGLALLPNAIEKPLKGVKKIGRSITHAFNSDYLPTLLSDKFGKGIINPSMAVSSVNKTFDNTYGDIVLVGDKALLDDSFLYKGDGDTSSIGWFTDSYDEVDDVFKTSAKMRKADSDSPVKQLSKEQFLGLEDHPVYHEVKRNRITGLNEFKHALVLEELTENPEMLEYLKEMGIPYTTYTKENKAKVLEALLKEHPELLFKNGGKLKNN